MPAVRTLMFCSSLSTYNYDVSNVDYYLNILNSPKRSVSKFKSFQLQYDIVLQKIKERKMDKISFDL